MAAVTRRQHAPGAHTPAPSRIAITPQFAADDLLTLQNVDSSLRTMTAHMSNPLEHSISSTDLNTSSELRTLHSVKYMLHLRNGVHTYVPEPLTAPKLVVPHGQRGIMLTSPRSIVWGLFFFSSLFSCLCCIFLQFYLHFTTDYTLYDCVCDE